MVSSTLFSSIQEHIFIQDVFAGIALILADQGHMVIQFIIILA